MTEEERQRFLQAQLLEQQRGLGFSDVFNNMVIDPAKQGIQDIGNALSNWWDNTQVVDIDIPNMQISSPMVKDIYNAAGYLGDALVYPYTNFQENYVENIEAPAIAAGQNADKVGSGLVDMAALMLKGEDASQVRQEIYENLIGGAGNSLWSAFSASDYSPLALFGGIRRVGNAGVDMARAARKLNLPKVSDELTNAVVKQNQIDAIGPPTTSAGYSFDPSMTAWDQLERIPDETFDVDADVIYDGARQYKDSTRDDINKRLSERGLTISSVNDSRASESQYWYVAPLSDPDDLIGTVRFSDHHDYFGGNDVDIRWGQKPDEITSDILEKINLDNYVPFDERMNRLPPTTIVPKPFVATTDIGLNDIVSHDKFGRGKILSVDGNKAEVLFDDGKTKMMHSSFLTTINKPKISDELVDAVSNTGSVVNNTPIAATNQNLNNELVEAVMANPETLSKLPTTPANRPEPLQVVHDAHRSYMERTGRAALTPDQYVQIQPAISAQVANAFENMEHAPNDPRVRASYDAMINETLDQYQVIKDTGLNIEFIPNGAKDPYGSPSELLADMKENNHLWVFPTDDGFGTVNSITDNPLLAMTDEVVGGKQLQANDVFRIVHDYFGHGLEGASFGARGEENAWLAHAGMYSDEARAAMTTETRGQNSWVNYGPHGEANRANQRNTVYADQKIGLLPDWTSRKPRGVNYVENYGQRTGGTQPTGSDASGVGPTTATGTGAAGDGLQPLQRPTITERGTLQLRHYSPIAGLETISPSQGGSNRMMGGDERYRRSHEGYVPRSYYGLNTGDAGGYSKEMNVGDSVYNVEIDADKVYDLTKDANNLYYEAIQLHPDDIKKQITAVERMIKDKGFSGYWNRGPMGMVAVIYNEIPTN